jgi:hypothetical protein
MYAATAVSAYSAVRQGEAQKANAIGEAAQMRAQGNTEQASAQRAYLEEKRQGAYVASRAKAVAAASGAGVSDPTVSNILSGIEGESEYRAQLYQGDVTARGLEYGAQVRRKEGDAAQSAGYLKGAATLFSGASSMYSKYGNGGPGGRVRPARGISMSDPTLQKVAVNTDLVPSPSF